MNLVLISYQCMKGFTSEDAYIVLIMIIPKLLLLLPLLLLAEAQNDSQRVWSNRLPLRRPVITPAFRPESTLSPIINTPITTKQIPEFVTQQYVPTSTVNNEKLTTKVAEIASVPSVTSETRAPNIGKVGFTIIFSNSYTETPIITSSTPTTPSTTTQRPIQRPSWFRPISRPGNIQSPSSPAEPSSLIVATSTSTAAQSTSTAAQSTSTVLPSTLTVAPITSTAAPITSTAAPITSTAAPITSTKSPSTLNVDPPTSTIANVDVAAKIPPANQEPGDRRPGFTIIFSDNYTKKPMTINTSPAYVNAPIISTVEENKIMAEIPLGSQDSEDRRPGYTIIYSDNYKKVPTTVNSSPVSAPIYSTSTVVSPSSSTVAPSTLTIENVEVAAKIPVANQEPEDKKPGFTVIFTNTSTKKPTTIDPPFASVVNKQPIQNPVQTNPTTFTPTSTVKQNTVYIPTQATNLPPKKPTESYSIIIIKNNNSDSNVNSQPIFDSPKKPGDSTTAPLPTTIPVITLTSQPSIVTTESEPVTNKFVTPRPSSVRPFSSRPIPSRPIPSRPTPSRPVFRPTTSNPTTFTPLIVTVASKAPAQVTNTPVTTPAWRSTTLLTTTTTRKPPTTTSTTLNPQTTWNPTTQSVGQQRPPQTNVINELRDYICRDVNGYYSLENKCDEYILCKNSTAFKNTCPDGLHFNPVARYPAYPCAYPTEVKCQNPSIKQPAQPTGECPHRFGHFPVPNGDCGHFMMCQEGAATIMTCPPGLAFNGKISACDWSINVPGCNPSAFDGFNCPAVKSDIYGNSAISNYGYKNSCKNYIACHEGHPRLLSCDAGLFFDEATAKCVESSLVKNCKN